MIILLACGLGQVFSRLVLLRLVQVAEVLTPTKHIVDQGLSKQLRSP